MLSATLAFIETRFAIFQGWDTHLLVAALVFGALAYRFDNRFVLSLALSTLAGYLGLKIAIFDTLDNDRLRFAAVLYGAFLIGVGLLLNRQRIKAHFLDVYLQLGANAILLAAISGVLETGSAMGLSRAAAGPLGRADLSRRSITAVLRLSLTARCMAMSGSSVRLLDTVGGSDLALSTSSSPAPSS